MLFGYFLLYLFIYYANNWLIDWLIDRRASKTSEKSDGGMLNVIFNHFDSIPLQHEAHYTGKQLDHGLYHPWKEFVGLLSTPKLKKRAYETMFYTNTHAVVSIKGAAEFENGRSTKKL